MTPTISISAKKQAFINRACVLRRVNSHPGQSVAEISDALKLEPKAVQQYLAYLNRSGLIRKVHHILADGKVSYLTAYSPGTGDDEKLRAPRKSTRPAAAMHQSGQVNRIVVPAVQIGLARDPMLVAFFGAAVHP